MDNPKRHRELIQDLRSFPGRHFDAPSALTLAVYLQGYQYHDSNFRDIYAAASSAVLLKHNTSLSIGAPGVLYAIYTDHAVGYEMFLSALEHALEAAGVGPRTEDGARFADVLGIIRQRPGMLIGSKDVVDLRYFFEGLLRAMDDTGEDTTEERNALGRLELCIQQDTRIVGRWDRVIRAQAMGAQGSIELFFDYCAEFNVFPALP